MAVTRILQQIGGFEVLGTLGHGGMGIVYRARDNTLQRELAIKVQTGDWKERPELLQRFLREARILASINHPNVVQIYSVGEHEGAPFFAMELLEGSIADAARLKMPAIDQVRRWMLDAARGLAAIHEMGVVHRDIKPGNLLLTRPTSVEAEHVKVADLGIASAGEQFGSPLTRAGAVMGTSGYLAPEAFRLEHTLDSRADQYSLGVVFFELLARRGPYQDMGDRALLAAIIEPRVAPDVREFRPEVDAATAMIVARMLRDEPDERFEDSAALVHALTQVQGSAAGPPNPIVAPAASAPGDSGPRLSLPRQNPAAETGPSAVARTGPGLKGVALIIVTLTIGFAAYHWQSVRSGSSLTPATTPADPLVGVAQDAPTPARIIDPMHREAWAKYVLGHYLLKSWAEGEETWTLDLLKQEGGLLAATLKGPEPQTVELTGRVDSQTTQTMDGETWDVYQLHLTGADDRSMAVRIEFSESYTSGEGVYVHATERLRFDVEDSEDL